MLFEALTGVKPYERDGELQTLFAHLRDEAPRVTALEPGLGAEIDAVLARALAKEPGSRFDSCAVLVAAAADALGVRTAEPEAAPAAVAMPRTFLFADIRGYTSFTGEHGDEAAGTLTRAFEATVREVCGAGEGRVLEIRGDEALVVFTSAREALRTAVALQERFAQDPPARGVGIGVDTGEASSSGAEYRGSALNVASRLCSLAGPGEILASETVIRVAGPTEGLAYGDRREERVKGVAEPVSFVPVGKEGEKPRIARRRGSRFGRRTAFVLVGAGLLIVAGAIVAGRLLLDDPSRAAVPQGVAGFQATSGRVSWQVPLDTEPTSLIRGGGGLWVYSWEAKSATRIDLKTHRSGKRIEIPDGVFPGAIVGTTMWAANDMAQVFKIDLRYGTVSKPIQLPTAGFEDSNGPSWLISGGGSIWVAYGIPFKIARLDPASGRLRGVIDPDPMRDYREHPEVRWSDAAALAFGDGNLWAADRGTGRLWRIDPATGEVAATGDLHGGWVEDLAAGGGYLWVPRTNDAGVWQVDKTVGHCG